MKLAAPLIPGVLLLTILGIGCATQKPAETTPASDPLDVTAPAPSTTAPAVARKAPTYTPPPARVFTPPPQPAYDPFAAPAPAAAVKTAAPAPAAGTHTVAKGDTFFKIARDRYGDGAKWQKIAAANPGVSAGSLKVGQKLRVP